MPPCAGYTGSEIATTLSKGHSAEEAVAKGRQAFARSITTALNSDVQSDDEYFGTKSSYEKRKL